MYSVLNFLTPLILNLSSKPHNQFQSSMSLLQTVLSSDFNPTKVRFNVDGRLALNGCKPIHPPTISDTGIIRCVGNNGASVEIDLHKVTDTFINSPYPIDNVETFFIPSAAIDCKLADGRKMECVGKCDAQSIRIDSVDMDEDYWFWLGINAQIIVQ